MDDLEIEKLAFQKRKELGLKGTIDGFVAGFKEAEMINYSQSEMEEIVRNTIHQFCTYFSDTLKDKLSDEWIEKIKKK